MNLVLVQGAAFQINSICRFYCCVCISFTFSLYSLYFYPPTVAGHTNFYVHFALFHTFLFIIAVLGPKKIKRLTFFARSIHVPFFLHLQ